MINGLSSANGINKDIIKEDNDSRRETDIQRDKTRTFKENQCKTSDFGK
jgi:hypothetical protein